MLPDHNDHLFLDLRWQWIAFKFKYLSLNDCFFCPPSLKGDESYLVKKCSRRSSSQKESLGRLFLVTLSTTAAPLYTRSAQRNSSSFFYEPPIANPVSQHLHITYCHHMYNHLLDMCTPHTLYV